MRDHTRDHLRCILPEREAWLANKIRRYIDQEQKLAFSGDPWLFEILHYATLGIPPVEIARLALALKRRKHEDQKISLRHLLTEIINTPVLTLFDTPVNEALRKTFQELEEMIISNHDKSLNLDHTGAVRETALREPIFAGRGRGHGQRPQIAPLEKAFISTLLSNFILHVTALGNYLRCPLKFYFETLIRMPCMRSEAATFGSAVHFALEQWFIKMQQDGRQQFPALEDVLKDFTHFMHQSRELFTWDHFEERICYGEFILSNYYQKNVQTCNKIVSVERNIGNVVVNGVRITGKIDKLEFIGKDVIIIDYKTGDLERALNKLQPPNDKSPQGGDYWRQAVFYHILVDNYPERDWNVGGFTFEFIESDHKVKVFIDKPDVETVTRQIGEVSHKIENHDFYTGCGQEDCYWCRFVIETGLDIDRTSKLAAITRQDQES